MTRKRCLITGTSAGIGLSLARCYLRAGCEVVGIDRDASKFGIAESDEERARLQEVQADLSDPLEVDRLIEVLGERLGKASFDIIIHNAGVNSVGPFESAVWQKQAALIEVNLTTPMVLTARFLEESWVAEGASIVFVSSLSHFVGYPGAASYAASKDGLAAYAQSLSAWLKPRGGHVLTVYPGPTRTDHARRHSPDNSREEKRMHPDELAQRIFRAVKERRRTLVPGLANRLFAAFGHWMPHKSDRAMKKAILDKL